MATIPVCNKTHIKQ